MLLTIVNDILDLATVDAGIMELDYTEINLTDLLDDVSMQFADRLHEAQVTLEITAPEGRYGWLNDFVYVGTLDSLRPQRDAVVIRVFKVL